MTFFKSYLLMQRFCLAAFLDYMTSPFSQSPHDRILWILVNSGGKMEQGRLRACTEIRYDFLNPILDKLASEGRIKVTLWKGWRYSILNKLINRLMLLSYVTYIKRLYRNLDENQVKRTLEESE